jgi:hypothetical protein
MLGLQRSVCLLFQTSGRFRINNEEGTNRSLELMMRLLADPDLHGEAVRYLGAAAEKELASHRAAAEVIGSHWGQATDCTAWGMDHYLPRATLSRVQPPGKESAGVANGNPDSGSQPQLPRYAPRRRHLWPVNAALLCGEAAAGTLSGRFCKASQLQLCSVGFT